MGSKLGQHFLVNKGAVKKIIAAASLEKSDAVLEIGPGRGALTFALAERAEKVIAVEKDAALAEELKKKLRKRNITHVDIVVNDILKFLVSNFTLQASSYKVVSNIPYYLTSALIRALLECAHKPDIILLMMQKEVAKRICAMDGKESILSLSVKFYAKPRILFFVSRGSFSPPPKVDSAVIEIIPKDGDLPIDPAAFFRLVKAGFSAPRKKLIGNLARALAISRDTIAAAFEKSGIDRDTRPEKVLLEQWVSLTKLF